MQINDFLINQEGDKLDIITVNGKIQIQPLACNHIQIISAKKKKISEVKDEK